MNGEQGFENWLDARGPRRGDQAPGEAIPNPAPVDA
jgi:hypothetical protein